MMESGTVDDEEWMTTKWETLKKVQSKTNHVLLHYLLEKEILERGNLILFSHLGTIVTSLIKF